MNRHSKQSFIQGPKYLEMSTCKSSQTLMSKAPTSVHLHDTHLRAALLLKGHPIKGSSYMLIRPIKAGADASMTPK